MSPMTHGTDPMVETREISCANGLANGEVVQFSMKINSHPRVLCVIRGIVEDFTILAGFEEQDRNYIVMAVDELAANIIRHSYKGATNKDIEYHVTVRDGMFEIIIRDFGVKFCCPGAPKLEEPKSTPHGLGLYIVHSVMDEVIFNTEVDAGTEVTLRKYRK